MFSRVMVWIVILRDRVGNDFDGDEDRVGKNWYGFCVGGGMFTMLGVVERDGVGRLRYALVIGFDGMDGCWKGNEEFAVDGYENEGIVFEFDGITVDEGIVDMLGLLELERDGGSKRREVGVFDDGDDTNCETGWKYRRRVFPFDLVDEFDEEDLDGEVCEEVAVEFAEEVVVVGFKERGWVWVLELVLEFVWTGGWPC